MNNLEKLINLPAKKEKGIRTLGVDLGTTNSVVSEVVWNPPDPPVCNVLEITQPTESGEYISPLVPSVVAELPDKTIWVGEGAKRLRATPQRAGLIFEKNLFYETKNDMGLKKTYYRAPEKLNHASKIAGVILSFLKEASEKTSEKGYDKISVTLPASFQMNQRRDTLLACQYANLNLKDDDLLDEPTAALIDFIVTNDTQKIFPSEGYAKCVVFDFGGGTCDVSVVEVMAESSSRKITLSALSISRYHRLGGGDIDAAIVYEALMPQLLKENHLFPLDLTWAQKKKGLEPQLLGKAEALKLSLCREIDRLMKFGKYNDTNKSEIIAKQPPIDCKLGKNHYTLSNPSLSAKKFEEILSPFLDQDFLYARETEYRLTQSIFSPLLDALQRAMLKPDDINFCLLVGGSSLIPHMKLAVEDFFKRAYVTSFSDFMDMQVSVSRGAAWNSFFKFLTGKPLIQPVLHEGIDILTRDNAKFNLIPSQAELPFPKDGSFKKVKLFVPKGELFVDKLKIEIVGESSGQTILNEIWQLPHHATYGDEITVEYRITSGKQFQWRAYLTDSPDEFFELQTENPLVNVLNPNSVLLKIEEAEEFLRGKKGGSAEDRGTFIRIARWYAELKQYERALDYLRVALNKLNKADAEILNLQGIYFDELGDYERSQKAYLEADRAASTWNGPLFNLALSLQRRRKYKEALDVIDESLKKYGEEGPILTLKAICLNALDLEDEKRKTLITARGFFESPRPLSDWELGWGNTLANMLGDPELRKRIEEEKNGRKNRHGLDDDGDILHPDSGSSLMKKED